MRDHGGTGLGLAIVSRIIRMMGGHVFVESNHGHGSSFVAQVSVPLAPSNVPSVSHDGEIVIDDTTFKLVDSPPAKKARKYPHYDSKVDASDDDDGQGTPQSTSRTLRKRVRCTACGSARVPKEEKQAGTPTEDLPLVLSPGNRDASITGPSLQVQQALARLLDITASSSTSTIVSLSSHSSSSATESKTMIMDDSPSLPERSFDPTLESSITNTPNLAERTVNNANESSSLPNTPLMTAVSSSPTLSSSSAEATPLAAPRSIGPSSRALGTSSSSSSSSSSSGTRSKRRTGTSTVTTTVVTAIAVAANRGDALAIEARDRYGPRLLLIVDDAPVNVKILLRMLNTFEVLLFCRGPFEDI
jgi:hypothetical protein